MDSTTPLAVRQACHVGNPANKHPHKQLNIDFSKQSPCLPEVVTRIESETSRHRRHSRGLSKTLHAKNAVTVTELSEPRSMVFTKDQLLQHYTQCIKLSQENKINHKNAFDLKLIEHMNEMLHQDGPLNFRLAGGTIFAGAKIYASRVDAVHSEIYRVLSSLGGEKDNANEEDNEMDDNETCGDDGKPKVKKRKKNSKILETNESNLRQPISHTYMPSSFERRFCKTAIDAASCSSLMLNQTEMLNLESTVPDKRRNTLSDDSTDVPEVNHFEGFPESCFETIHDLGNTQSACESLVDFEFGIDLVSSPLPHLNSPQTTDSQSLVGNEKNSEELNCVLSDTIDDDLPQLDNDEESMFISPENEKKPVPASFTGDFLDPQLLSVEPLEYSYFKPSVFAMHNGPEHWKHHSGRHTSQKASDKDDKNAPPKKRERKTEKSWKYMEKPVIGKLQPQKLTKAKKADLQANRDNNLRVEVPSFCKNNLLTLRMVKGVTVKPLTADAIAKAGVMISSDVTDVISKFKYHNDDFCPAVVDNDYEDNDPDSTELGFSNSAYNASESVLPTNQAANEDSNHVEYSDLIQGDHLITQPKKVAKIDVAFATRAKRVNVRKLKSAMWSILDHQEQNKSKDLEASHNDASETIDISQGSTEQTTDKEITTGPMNFTDLYKVLPQKISENFREDLSVPLAFTCLLHLANEKNLKIENNASLNDLKISMEE